MQLPSIPTDNLYKFVAISGLALCAFAVTYPTSKALELKNSAIETHAQIRKLQIELDGLSADVDAFKSKAPEQRRQEEHAALSKSLKAIQLKKVDIDAAVEKLDLNRDWAWAYLLFAAIAGLVGSIATTRGFRLWYNRVQRPQDQKLLAPPGEA